ncbi:YciI family protein [Arenicella sp. 4NH20-0111]|uniref:YciI family protein n=1 Tax=Arenicella sp. 4NH20-0111 TaxID=3127648 RepID=UPI0033403641
MNSRKSDVDYGVFINIYYRGVFMQFLAMIYSTEDQDDVDFDTLIGQYAALEAEMEAAGVTFSGNALQPVSTATSVRSRNGRVELTDGPYAETKEQLGGYYLFECESLDEAIRWASKIPSARYGSIEIRPVMEFES